MSLGIGGRENSWIGNGSYSMSVYGPTADENAGEMADGKFGYSISR